MLLANVCKLNVTRFPFEIARNAIDIAGGLLGTMPSAADFADEETGPYIRKYLAASSDYDVTDRIKVMRFIENLSREPGPSPTSSSRCTARARRRRSGS